MRQREAEEKVAAANASVLAANAEAKAAADQLAHKGPIVLPPSILPVDDESAADSAQRQEAARQEFQLRQELAKLGGSRGSSRTSSPSRMRTPLRGSHPSSPSFRIRKAEWPGPAARSRTAGLRMLRQISELNQHPCAIFARFTHANNAPRADADACVTNVLQRFQTIIVGPCTDDFLIVLG